MLDRKNIDILAIADGASDTKEGGFAAECLLKAIEKTAIIEQKIIDKILFESMHNSALLLFNDNERNSNRKALTAYAIVLITKESKLYACSMGDAMFVVYRNGQPVFNTTEFVKEDNS